MEESAALLKLASDDPSIKIAAAVEARRTLSQNGVPAMKKLVQTGRALRRPNSRRR